MLTRILDVPDGVDALAAIGTLTKEDYEQSIEPILDEARRSGRRLRLLIQIGPEYEGYTAGAAWEKSVNAFRNPSLLRLLDGYAVVTDLHWLREWSHIMAFFLPFPLRVFGMAERAEAIAWLSALPQGPGVSHHLEPESGVLVVEVTEPLRAQDFDALAATADAWLETHERLPGVVVHAREFPRMGEHRGHAATPALRARPPSEGPPGGVGRRRRAGRSGTPPERALRPGGDQGLRVRRARPCPGLGRRSDDRARSRLARGGHAPRPVAGRGVCREEPAMGEGPATPAAASAGSRPDR